MSGRQGLARVGPFEWSSPIAVVIPDVIQDFIRQVLLAGKVAAFQDIAAQKREPDFDLIEPRGVKGKKVKDNAFVGLLKDLFSFVLRHFLPFQTAGLGHQLSDRFSHRSLEIVHNDVDFFSRIRMLFQNQPQETAKLLGTMPFKDTSQDLPLVRVESGKQRPRAMPDVTELPQERLTRQDRLIRNDPFKGLHPRLLVDTKDNALRRRLQVKPDNPKHFFFKERVGRIQPVTPLPGLDFSFVEPPPDRIQRNRSDDPLSDRLLPKQSVTPRLKSPADLSRRFENKLDKPMFGLRGKRRSELRDAASLSAPLAGFSKTVSSISVPYARGFQDGGQSQRLKSLDLRAKSSWPLNNPEQEASGSSTAFPDASFLRLSTQRPEHGVLSLRPPRFPSEEDRLKPYTNLSNSVLEHYAPLVSVGSYVIVQGTDSGAYEGVREFLKTNKNFVIDRSKEKFLLTRYPSGFLRRVG